MSDKFKYEYKALTKEERKEIESIKKEYLPKTKEEEALSQIRLLDKKVKNIPLIISLTIGVFGILIFGLGLCFFLKWIDYFFVGIPFVLIGIILMSIAYPLHVKIRSKLSEKYKSKILQLADELLNNE